MLLLRLSGHSGAGKSRLIAALPRLGITCPRAVLYTSRLARAGEVHGRDYYFLSRSAIAALPGSDFYVGPVREMLQGVDLGQLEIELRSNSLVLVEIFAPLWAGLEKRIRERVGPELHTASVFMTAVDPKAFRAQPDEKRAHYVQETIEDILRRRAKDADDKISSRARSGFAEIAEALGPHGNTLYNRVFHSAPEGPDGDDDWTKEGQPIGRARDALDEFVAFVRTTQAPPV
jgi:hypothetical protein